MNDRIRPYASNPFYWQYKGKPVLLLGGSVEDNLFQVDDIDAHLDLLRRVGGNYVRCTMSSRDEGDVWPFHQRDDGLYDLKEFGADYWRRFEHFVEACFQRDIAAQFEMWCRFDLARPPWPLTPCNTKNSVNDAADERGLREAFDAHPGRNENRFFHTPPTRDDNTAVRPFQEAFVERVLEVTLDYPNVLYCMDNETSGDAAWGAYWARWIRKHAEVHGVAVHVTEMWDKWDLTDPMHEQTWQHPDLYSFCDISQGNHQPGSEHQERMLAFRQLIIDSGHIRPLNTVKIYGANTGRYGTNRDAQERFWRNIFAGLAGTRFHRPPSGLGLSNLAQKHIHAGRVLADAMNLFQCEPRNDLLSFNSYNEAYCLANVGTEYAVVFMDGGMVLLDTNDSAVQARWLDIASGQWHEPQRLEPQHGRVNVHIVNDGKVFLQTPRDEGFWSVHLSTG